MTPQRAGGAVLLGAAGMVVLSSLGACGRTPDGPAADTAELSVDGDRYLLDLEACGLDPGAAADGDDGPSPTAFLVGQDGEVGLQLVAGADAEEALQAAATAFTVDGLGPQPVAAVGPDAADLLPPGAVPAAPGRAVGEVRSVDRDGDRIRVEATATSPQGEVEVRIDARCPDSGDA